MANQLYTKDNSDKKNVFPKNYTDNIRDKETNKTLTEILQGFNCIFLSFTGSVETTLLEVPISARKQGLLVTYTDYTNTVYIKFYNNKSIEDKDFIKESNWKELTKISAGIEQTTGESEDRVMSQKAVTLELRDLEERITENQLAPARKELNLIKQQLKNITDDEDLHKVPVLREDPITGTIQEYDTLQFKNRIYNPESPNGMGYIILRKNDINTGRELTFKEQVEGADKENTIFEIRYDFDLKGGTVTIPKNCILKFEGGKLTNGTIIGNRTDISSRPKHILDVDLKGTWSIEGGYAEWFGAITDGSTDCTSAIQRGVNTFNTLHLIEGVYQVSRTITIYR